jgi:hypothetical protein
MEEESFYKKAESFFIQLQYGLGFHPEPIASVQENLLSHALEPKQFFNLIDNYGIQYPFLIDVEIIKLKNLALNQGISDNDVSTIFEELKKQYWFGNPIVFIEEINKAKDVISKIDNTIDSIEFVSNYIKFLEEKRDNIYNQLIDVFFEKDTNINKEVSYPHTETVVQFDPKIFKDEYSVQLFNYLVDHYHNGKDKELSNIYQWMENANFIHQNRRQEYKKLVKDYNITKQKYSRIHTSNEYEPSKIDPTLNELQKQFNKIIKE